MIKIRSIGIVLLLIALPLAADDLEGLWKAKRWFGPFARGPLTVQRSGSAYTAEMMGKTVPVRVDQGELSFELPNGQGSFRGRLRDGGVLRGHWYQPEAINGKYASPVQLTPEGPDRWSGHRELHPEPPRNADGVGGQPGDPRHPDRPAWKIGAGRVFPRRAPRQAARYALGGQERDGDDRGRRDAGRRAAEAVHPDLSGYERRRLPGGPGAAEAGHDP